MKNFLKGWVRLIIEVFLIILTLFLVILFFGDVSQAEFAFSGFLGSAVVVGQLLFYLAFDLLGYKESKFAGALRIILSILGTVITLVAGVVSLIFYSQADFSEYSPWFFAVYGQWFANGIILFILYCIISDQALPDICYPFAQLVSFLAGYILFVIFGYIGTAAGQFYYGYLGLIVCFAAFVITCFIIKRNGIPFGADGFKELQREVAKMNGSTKKPQTYVDDDFVDNRASGEGFFVSKIESAVSSAISSAISSCEYGYYGRINVSQTRIERTVIFGSIRVYGTVVYEITWNDKQDPYLQRKFKDEMNETVKELISSIKSEIDDAIDEGVERYKVFDGKWNINVKLSGQLKI